MPCDQEPSEKTIEYNEPSEAANAAAAARGGEQRPENTMKYNEPPAPTNDAPPAGHAERLQRTTKYNGSRRLPDGVAQFNRPKPIDRMLLTRSKELNP
jgi:hypothetical protein